MAVALLVRAPAGRGMSDPDAGIDELYQGDLAAFVAARNALAKALKRPDLKTLEKPTAPAWAVNQLFWHDRAVFDRLVEASDALRAAHRDALSGQPADLRGAETTHRAALREALSGAQRALTGGGHAASPATLDAIRRTLEALPHPEAHGRLVQPLAPAGLEALAGLTVTPAAARPAAHTPRPHADAVTAATPTQPAASTPPAARSARGPATVTPFPPRPDAEAARAAAREREVAAREAREREAKAREERQRAADDALRVAAKNYERAQAAVADAEAQLSAARQARDAAAAAYETAKRAVRELV